jgi:hypothetical protein
LSELDEVYESQKLSLGNMVDIASETFHVYKIPCYQHYNWCLDYLESPKPRVINPACLLSWEEQREVQKVMVEACTKYLEELENNIE